MATITKTKAIEESKAYGIDFSLDVFQVSFSDKLFMADLAKKAGYRKSPSSSLSRGSAFYVHLQKWL